MRNLRIKVQPTWSRPTMLSRKDNKLGGISLFAPLVFLICSEMVFAQGVRIASKEELLCQSFYEDKRYTEAVDYCLDLANQGSPLANNVLGLMYLNGFGRAQDFQNAYRHFLIASDAGYAVSSFHIGEMFEYGMGTQKNIPKALDWYDLATKQGYFSASQSALILRQELENSKRDSGDVNKDNFSYLAVLSCNIRGQHFRILACLGNSQLTLRNHGRTQVVDSLTLVRSLEETKGGVQIELSEKFHIIVQNVGDSPLALELRIFDRQGNEVYQDMVGKFGVINVANQ